MKHSATADAHRAHAPQALRWAVVTISDTRTRDTDETGRLLVDALQHAGHTVLEHVLVPDDIDEVRGTVAMLVRDPELDAVVTNGGTGLAARDVAIEALAPLLGKTLPGFGELFRHLSYEVIGPAAYASRAQAGTLAAPDATKLVFQLPGSPQAAELAVADLILPEAGHLFREANRRLDLDERFKPKPRKGG